MKQATTKRLTSIADLEVWRQALVAAVDAHRRRIRVCDGTGCRALGSRQVIANLQEELDRVGLAAEVDVVATGCPGFCEQGPLLTIDPAGIAYNHVQIDDAAQIVNETIVGGQILDRLIYVEPESGQAIVQEQRLPFYARQVRRVLELNGQIDPTKIEDYIAAGGYSALSIALQRLTPQDVIEEVKGSGLRGRGGAGFSTGVKWQLCRNAPGEIKYLICNADEGDPGAFMDRSILEGNPHSVLEGMLIGAYAMGASQGYIYIRAEYPLAIKHLQIALEQMHALGLLGKNILGSGLDFDIEMRIGAGAFVCGEETALMASIEGRTGEPRQRPPFPAQSGLWGKPTNINNVKSWANVPLIIAKGADWFAEVGTESSKGTVIFSVVGKIRNTGLVEVPMGISLHELIFSIGGGVPDGKAFKAAQIGGPSGGCIPAAHLDTPIDYESLGKLGAIMGSGGLVVADEDTCMVDLARYFMSFTQEESCGKCVPCRVGTKAMLATLERICAGQGRPGDIEYLEELAQEVKASSLCGLGQTAPNPVLTTIRYFRDEYEAHILEQRCPAGVCTALVRAPCVSACPAGVDVPATCRWWPRAATPRRWLYTATPTPSPDLRPRLPGLLRGASASAAGWTSPSPSATSSASWPTTSTRCPGRRRGWPRPRAKGGRDRRRAVRADGRAAPGPAGLRRHRLRAHARAGRHDDLRHPGLPPAPRAPLRRDRQHPAGGGGDPLRRRAGQRLHRQEPASRRLRSHCAGSGRAPEPAAGRRGRGLARGLPRRADAA
jgi:NADH-quinone oxidoreductase subunit F